MAGRPANEVIASAVARGAISERRAAYWQVQAARGVDVSVLDTLTAVRPPAAQVAAAMSHAPPGHDPVLYAENPLHAEMRRSKPALVRAAERENGPPPKLFGDKHLPAFTASGLDPATLAAEPWPIRRAMASAPTLKDAYDLHDKYADAPEMAHADHAHSPANQPYASDFSAWLAGRPGGTPAGGNAHPPEVGASAGDYSTEQLHQELFGGHAYPAPPPVVPVQVKTTKGT